MQRCAVGGEAPGIDLDSQLESLGPCTAAPRDHVHLIPRARLLLARYLARIEATSNASTGTVAF